MIDMFMARLSPDDAAVKIARFVELREQLRSDIAGNALVNHALIGELLVMMADALTGEFERDRDG